MENIMLMDKGHITKMTMLLKSNLLIQDMFLSQTGHLQNKKSYFKFISMELKITQCDAQF